MENIFGIYKKILAKESTEGDPHLVHKGGGRTHPLGARPLTLWVPQTSTNLNSNSIYSCSGKQSERRIHRVLRYGASAKP